MMKKKNVSLVYLGGRWPIVFLCFQGINNIFLNMFLFKCEGLCLKIMTIDRYIFKKLTMTLVTN
jgi:hypothetical protein